MIPDLLHVQQSKFRCSILFSLHGSDTCELVDEVEIVISSSLIYYLRSDHFASTQKLEKISGENSCCFAFIFFLNL